MLTLTQHEIVQLEQRLVDAQEAAKKLAKVEKAMTGQGVSPYDLKGTVVVNLQVLETRCREAAEALQKTSW